MTDARRLLRAAVALILGGAGAAACDPMNTDFDPVEPGRMFFAKVIEPAPAPETITLMTWNVKFGGARADFFFDCHGDRSQMSKDEVLANLAAVALEIDRSGADIVVLQEVDLSSKRSAYVNQVQYLLDHTRLGFGAYASQWKADLVPQDGIGRVDTGNVILSRWPLAEAWRLALREVTEFDFLTNYFWLKRNILKARVHMPGGRPLWILNIHAAAWSKDGTKRSHIDRFHAELDALAADGAVVVGAGDLNSVPPGTVQTGDFDDSACTDEFEAVDYDGEDDWLGGLYDTFEAAIPLDDYRADNAPHFTHTTARDGFWNRKLDYVFTSGAFAPGTALTHQDRATGGVATMPLSDHAPITVDLLWDPAP